MKTAYIGLGSNSGNRAEYIEQALRMLGQTEGIKVVAVSDVVETPPLKRPDQPNYLNAAVQIETSLKADELFNRTTAIENILGRVRTEKWSSRTIDLDLLLYQDEIINTDSLTIPHSQMHLRTFGLKGLCQLAPEMHHPVLKRSMRTLAERLNGSDFTINPDVPQLISVAGLIGVGKTTLTKNLVRMLSCKAVYEEYDTNPFLQQVYAGKKELALDSELYFLASRLRQLNPAVLQNGKVVIADYAFEAELIYSKRLLDPQQLELHNQIFPHLAAKVTKPVLALYLQDSARNCLKRIHDRNRPYEQGIELDFLDKLSDDYENLFAQWHTCPVLRISKSNFDCTKANDIAELVDQIKHYTVLGSWKQQRQ